MKGAYCDVHTKIKKQEVDVKRESSTQRGYGYRWQQTSKGFLRSHPLCQCPDCLEGAIRLLAAEVVDHKIPHKLKEANDSGDQVRIDKAFALFWDRTNWQSMSKACHDKKTAKEDGGFGRGRGH